MRAATAVFGCDDGAVVWAARGAARNDHARGVWVDTQTAGWAFLGRPSTVLLIASPAEDL